MYHADDGSPHLTELLPEGAVHHADARNDFLEASHADNSKVTLLVAHVWAVTHMPVDELERVCIDAFDKSDRLMKNALFSFRVHTGAIRPALTFYKPKHSAKYRMHITGAKSWSDLSAVANLVGDVVRGHGFDFEIEEPDIDLVNLKFKLRDLRIRTVPECIRRMGRARGSGDKWVVPPEELQPGRPINISCAHTTILMWSSGSTLVMLKRVKRGQYAIEQLAKSTAVLQRIAHECATNTN
jgi:hypothetical protein